MGRLLVGRQSHAWRPGDPTAGSRSLDGTPPGTPEASARGDLGTLRAKGRAGDPPAISTGYRSRPPRLGNSAMAYRSHEIALDSCGGDGSKLVLLDGARARARTGAKNDLAERAKGRNRPICTRATHIAMPLRYKVGEFSNEKSRGLMLRSTNGPRAALRYAAHSSPIRPDTLRNIGIELLSPS